MASILFLPIGWIYLWIRYRNKEKVKKTLQEKYDDNYSIAGAMLIWSFFGVILLILISLFLMVTIANIIYDLINHTNVSFFS